LFLTPSTPPQFRTPPRGAPRRGSSRSGCCLGSALGYAIRVPPPYPNRCGVRIACRVNARSSATAPSWQPFLHYRTPGNDVARLLPLTLFRTKRLLSRLCDPIEPGAPVVFRNDPFGCDPALLFELQQYRI